MVGSPCCLECSELHCDAQWGERIAEAVGMDCIGLWVVHCFWRGCRWMEVVQSLRLVAMESTF
jgi:hypothetical protein